MIRPAIADDLPRMMFLAVTMHQESPRYRDIPFDEGKVGSLLLKLMQSEDGFLWVAEELGRGVVGALAATAYELWFSTARVAGDFGLFMHPDFRGGLAAARLVRRYREWGKEQGLVGTDLGHTTGIEPDRYDRFIRCLGFEETGRLYTAGGG